MRCWQLEAQLENLAGSGYDQRPISPETYTSGRINYNCIAYAAGETDKWWWPKPNKFASYWPEHLPREPLNLETVENFLRAFEWKGYKRGCKNGKFKRGIEKVAIFTVAGVPKHAARQLESGCWTSKCGGLQDIEHETLAAVEGKFYGRATIFLHRRRDGKPFLMDRMRAWLKSVFTKT